MHRAVLALLLLCSVACADTLIVRDITITGLRRTRPWVVERELHFAVGDTVTAGDLAAAKRRVQNLSLFSDVRLAADSTGCVTLELAELWPLFPLLWLEFTEGQFSDVVRKPDTFFERVTVSAGAIHFNLSGTGGRLYALAQFGAAEGYQVGYQTRWLAPGWPLALRLKAENLRMSDRHAAVLDSGRSLRIARYEANIATRDGAPTRIGLQLRYHGVRQETTWPAEGRHDRTFWSSPYIVMDRRDLQWYPSRGSFTQVIADVAEGTVRFIRSTYDLRAYLPFTAAERPPLAALRIAAATSTDGTPSWAHFYHGFNSGLRGYSTVKSESAGYLLGSIEFRFPLGRESTYDLPLFGRYGRRLPWGVSALAGIERAELQLGGARSELLGFSTGFYFRIPYLEILELSAAADRDGNLEYLAATGVRF